MAVGVCNLKHTGGAREALLGKVVKLYFRYDMYMCIYVYMYVYERICRR